MLLARLLADHRSLATCRSHVSQSVAHASNQLHDSIGWESTILSDDRRAQVTASHPLFWSSSCFPVVYNTRANR